MKKLLLMLGVVLCSLNAAAQLVFVDKNGKELADGTTITMKEVVLNDYDEPQIDLKGVSIRNKSDEPVDFSMNAVVSTLPSGEFTCCFGDLCLNAKKPMTIKLKNLSIKAGATDLIERTEWVPEEGEFGTAKVKFVLSTGNTLNVEFVYADPASLKDLAAGKKIVAVYDVTGKMVKGLKKGLNLVRYADGSVRKHIVK